MLKVSSVAVCALAFATGAMAQGKINTKWHCPAISPAPQKFDVGDMPDHSYQINQGTCTATSNDKGFAEKSGAYTEFQESWKDKMTARGVFTVTMDNGDMVYYSYNVTGSTDMKKPAHDMWKSVRGTGKYKGIMASGSCTGTFADDMSSDWTCMGTYTMGGGMGMAAPAKGKPMAQQP